MEYESLEIVNLTNQLKKKLTINFFFTLIIFIAFSFFLYLKNKELDIVFFVCESILMIALAIIQYSQIVTKGLIVNKTAIEIQIDDENITIKTAPFKVLFWINRPQVELKFKINEIRINRTPYNLKEIYDLDTYVISINHKKQSAFIISDYFDESLGVKLKEIKEFNQ